MTLLFNLTPKEIELIGYIGSFLTSVIYLPQVYQAWKTKSVDDLSVWMVILALISTIVWLIYGFGIDNGGPIIVANLVVLTLSLLLLYFKLTFKK
jgi:MtN3 and saliva related transmembrane protein